MMENRTRGIKANDPNTPYYVYEFSFNGQVFDVLHTFHHVRSHVFEATLGDESQPLHDTWREIAK